jgi:hypothetical protein
MSVRTYRRRFHWTDFREIWYWGLYENMWEITDFIKIVQEISSPLHEDVLLLPETLKRHTSTVHSNLRRNSAKGTQFWFSMQRSYNVSTQYVTSKRQLRNNCKHRSLWGMNFRHHIELSLKHPLFLHSWIVPGVIQSFVTQIRCSETFPLAYHEMRLTRSVFHQYYICISKEAKIGKTGWGRGWVI